MAPSSPSPIRAMRCLKAREAAGRFRGLIASSCRATWEDIASVDAVVLRKIKKQWGTMDFLVHAVAFSDKNELKGRYADSTRENFIRTMVISCYAFTEAAKGAPPL